MQNDIEGCFLQKIIPHTLRRYALSDQASSGRFLFIAEHYKCGRTGLLNTKTGPTLKASFIFSEHRLQWQVVQRGNQDDAIKVVNRKLPEHCISHLKLTIRVLP